LKEKKIGFHTFKSFMTDASNIIFDDFGI